MIAAGPDPGRDEVVAVHRPETDPKDGTMTHPADGSARFRDPTRTISRVMLGMLALGVVWRVARFAARQPLWGDEAFIAVNLLVRDAAGMLRTLEYYQIVPLGFLWAQLAVVGVLGGSEWAVRLIPFLAGLGALALFARFAARTVDRRSAALAVAIFAASYYPVRHATEVKPYATDLLIALGATHLAWSLGRNLGSIRRWTALTLVVGLGVWCSYPLVFVAFGLGVFLLGRLIRQSDPRGWAGFGSFGLIGAASWLASYLAFGRPQAQAAPFYSRLETWRGAFPPLRQPWEIPGWLLDVHTGNMLAYPLGGNHYASAGTALLVVLGAAYLGRRRADLVVLLLGPLPPMLLAACFGLYPYGTSARTTLFLAPAFCLLASVGAVGSIRRVRSAPRRRRCFAALIVGLAAIPLVASVANVALPYKNWEDRLNRQVVEALARLARPGDRWLVTDGLDNQLASRHAILEHWIQQVAEVKYNILARSPAPTRWLPDPAALVDATQAGRTWLIVHRTGCPNFDEAYVAAERRQLERRLGPPEVHEFGLTRGESVTAYYYPAPSPTASPPTGLETELEQLSPRPPGRQVVGNWAFRYDDPGRGP